MIYYKNTDPLIRNLPIGLTPGEVTDPYLVLNSFFAYGEYLPKHRKRIKRWLIAALDVEYQWEHEELLGCLGHFEGVARLMEALWLIHQNGDFFTPEDIAIRQDDDKSDAWTEEVYEEILRRNNDEMDFHPDFLTMEEEKVPHEVIHNLFKGQDLFDGKDKLDRWCLTAISYYMERVVIDRYSLISIFEQINKAIEASFIITEVRELKAQAKREEEESCKELK